MPKIKNMSNSEKAAVITDLFADSKDGTLRHGALEATADKYNCDWRTVRLLWKRYNEQKEAGVGAPHQTFRRKGNSGRKCIELEELRERLQDMPLNHRTTVRRLAAALDIPRSTLHENLKTLGLRAHSDAIKPFLTDAGNLERVRWVLRWVGVSSTSSAVATPAREIHRFGDFGVYFT